MSYETVDEETGNTISQEFIILGCFKTNNPQNIFVVSPTLDSLLRVIFGVFVIISIIIIFEAIVLSINWFDHDTMSFTFVILANLYGIGIGLVLFIGIIIILGIITLLYEAIININKEFNSQKNNPEIKTHDPMSSEDIK
jgi:hypothetical protein